MPAFWTVSLSSVSLKLTFKLKSGEKTNWGKKKMKRRFYKVEILRSPVTERYVKPGYTGLLDTLTNKIQVNGHWFDFNNNWLTTFPYPSLKAQELTVEQ